MARTPWARALVRKGPMANFGLIGVGGYVAPRHLRAIRNAGHQLLAAVDPHDAVGVLDRYFPEAKFFSEIERFDRHLEKLRRRGEAERLHFLSICSPNFLHDAHVRLALRVRADAICEKPLVISPWNLDQLAQLEEEYGGRVHTVLQLRLHPAMRALQARLLNQRERVQVVLSYVTRRGPWYSVSWKGSESKSGGLAMNIGVHFFDILLWLFGRCQQSQVHLREPRRIGGVLELERARVSWFLSVEAADLPEAARQAGQCAYRSLTVDGQPVDFSEGFEDLHDQVYTEILAGRGFGIEDARPSIELVYRIRKSPIETPGPEAHPLLQGGSVT